MKKVIILPKEHLKSLISINEKENLLEAEMLKDQLKDTIEGMNPINMIKKAIFEPQKHAGLIQNVLGFSTGYIARKIVTGRSINPIINIGGEVLEFVTRNVVARNTVEIKSAAKVIFRKIFGKKSKTAQRRHDY